MTRQYTVASSTKKPKNLHEHYVLAGFLFPAVPCDTFTAHVIAGTFSSPYTYRREVYTFMALTDLALRTAKIAPVSPGEMLQEEFLKPLGLTSYRLAKDIDVPVTRVYDIVAGKRAVTAETDLLLCRYFGLSDGWWLAVQSHHDTHQARRELGKRLDAIERCPLLDAVAP